MTEEEKDFLLRQLEFEKSLELRNFEIDNFWKRGWFFGALLLAIASGYFELLNGKNESYCLYFALLGLIVSTSQMLMNRGSKYWQERWENKTKNRESILGIDLTKTRKFPQEKYYLDASTLAKDENWLTVARRYSVSKLTILVWDIIALFWAALWIKEWRLDLMGTPISSINWSGIIINILILLYIFLFIFMKRPSRDHKIRRWYYFAAKGGGGKVLGSFTKKNDDNHKSDNDNHYFDDSENYINNLKEKISGKNYYNFFPLIPNQLQNKIKDYSLLSKISLYICNEHNPQTVQTVFLIIPSCSCLTSLTDGKNKNT